MALIFNIDAVVIRRDRPVTRPDLIRTGHYDWKGAALTSRGLEGADWKGAALNCED